MCELGLLDPGVQAHHKTGSELFPWGQFSISARSPFSVHSFQRGCKSGTSDLSRKFYLQWASWANHVCTLIHAHLCHCSVELVSHFPEEGTLELWLPPVDIRHTTSSGGFQGLNLISASSTGVADDPVQKIRGTQKTDSWVGGVHWPNSGETFPSHQSLPVGTTHAKSLFSSSLRRWTVSYLHKLCRVTEE